MKETIKLHRCYPNGLRCSVRSYTTCKVICELCKELRFERMREKVVVRCSLRDGPDQVVQKSAFAVRFGHQWVLVLP